MLNMATSTAFAVAALRFLIQFTIIGLLVLGIGLLRTVYFAIQIFGFVSGLAQEILMLGLEYLGSNTMQHRPPTPPVEEHTNSQTAAASTQRYSPPHPNTPSRPLSISVDSAPSLSTAPLSDGSRTAFSPASLYGTVLLNPVPTFFLTSPSEISLAARRQARRIALGLPNIPETPEKKSTSKVVDRILEIENRAPPNTPEETENPWGSPEIWLKDQDGEEETAEREPRPRDKLLRGSLKGVRVSEEFALFFDT